MPCSTPRAAFSCFDGHRCIARGELLPVALVLRARRAEGTSGPLLVFDNHSGQALDIDTAGSKQELRHRMAAWLRARTPEDSPPREAAPAQSRGRGRPKLGVVAKEVTLLPRHWEWLATQPGGASVVLRTLVDEAHRGDALLRTRAERASQFMSAVASDLPDVEEASKAMFAHDHQRFIELIAQWPADIRDHATDLAFDGTCANTDRPC